MEAGQTGGTIKGKVTVTVVGALAGAPISYIFQRMLASWGILDDVSDALGRWLKVNITAPQAGWTIAAIITLALYAIVLWRVWHRQIVHIHHKEMTAVSKVTASLDMVVHRTPSNYVSLMEASRIAYECAEANGFQALVDASQLTAADKLHWMQTSIVVHQPALRLYGVRPPSTISRLIEGTHRASLHAIHGESTLVSDFAADTARYEDVLVSREDLASYLQWLAQIGSASI